MYGRITREEAIKAVGLESVEKVETENVEFTCRITDTTNPGMTEFSATVDVDDDRSLVMYCYCNSEDVESAEELDQLDWDEAIADAEFLVV